MSTREDPRSPFVANAGPHPWRRYVAIGDSFTEGVGDPEPSAPHALRGWADRVAEVLSEQVDFLFGAEVATLLSHECSSARVLPLTLTKASSCFDWGKTG